MKLLRSKKILRHITKVPLKATDVLYQKMHTYNKEAKEILSYIIENIKQQNKNSPALRELYLLMKKADELAIDCAHKLAPYQTPKLESIEVRNKVEHKFVLRAPKAVSSIEEWTKLTGAGKLSPEQINTKVKELTPAAESLYDFDEEQDQIETQKNLH